MKKLVQINATCNWGSTGRIAEQIGLLAKEKGWECYIVHGSRYIKLTQLISIEVGTRLDNWIHASLSKLFGLHGLGSYFATKRVIKKLMQIRPDIVHLHNIHGYYLNYPLLFKFLNKSDIPVIWTLHDCWTMTGHCTHFDSIGCDRWKTLCHDCPLKRAQYKTLLFNNTRCNHKLKEKYFTSVERNLTIITVSNWLKSIVQNSYLKNASIQVINNGIDLTVFHPINSNIKERLHIAENKTVLLGVATDWDNEKGLSEFLMLSQYPQYQIILIGLNQKQIKGLPQGIIGISRTNNQKELAEYYSIADIFVNPTYNDSFPTVNIESLACGTPVITYNTGGSPEIIDDLTGIVVERGNFSSLVRAIERCRENGKITYSTQCITRAQNFFNKDERFIDYINLYESVLNKRNLEQPKEN